MSTTTTHVRVSAQKAADSLSKAAGELQDALTDCASALEAIVPENVEDTVEARLKEVEEAVKAIDEIKQQFDETDWEAVKAIDEIKQQFDETDWDAVTKASEVDPDDFVQTKDFDPDDFLKKDELNDEYIKKDDFDPDDYVKNDDLPDFDDFVKNDDIPDLTSVDLEQMDSDIDDLKNRMDKFEDPSDVKELETKLTEANDRIAALEARLVEAEKVVVPLKQLFALLAAFAPKG